MSFTAIDLQGHILNSDLIEKIRQDEGIAYQAPKDFGLSGSLRDEINLAWGEARNDWRNFKARWEQENANNNATTLTRKRLLEPLLHTLGYQVEHQKRGEQVNCHLYPISYRDDQRNGLPIHLVGANLSLDKRSQNGGPRLSPHGLVQEYLNSTEHLYGLVSNGRYLRLLRDATRLTRLSYVQFDLQSIFEDELFGEFALLYRLLHASRMPLAPEQADESIIEHYHQKALEEGARIREKLSGAVKTSIQTLGRELLNQNQQVFQQKLQQGGYDQHAYYQDLLRIIYRLLFLLTTEARDLIYPKPEERGQAEPQQQKLKQLYEQYYSVQRLVRLARNKTFIDSRATDLWQGLVVTFRLFEDPKVGEKLGIGPLGSGLFAPTKTGPAGEGTFSSHFPALQDLSLSNGTLLQVIDALTSFENEQNQQVPVNYAALDVEELGSVYEGLLDFDGKIEQTSAGSYTFRLDTSSERKSTSSHYTPEELVKPLIDHSLHYQIEAAKQGQQPERALLQIKVADPACGSGHILLSAARRMGIALAQIRTGEDQPGPSEQRKAVRNVIQHCIYGVDRNPMALELCKVALWLEAHDPGQPLNFLDHHIKQGDSLVGLARLEELRAGIPSEAFDRQPGDDQAVASKWKRANTKARKDRSATQLELGMNQVAQPLEKLQEAHEDILRMPERTPAEVHAKERAYGKLINGPAWLRLKTLADTLVASFFTPKDAAHEACLLTDQQFRNLLQGREHNQQATGWANAVAVQQNAFHWFLEFPEILNGAEDQAGFHCILCNVPFLGGQHISGTFSSYYLNYLTTTYPHSGAIDLAGFFFRRIYQLIRSQGFQSLIATNTIAQGKTRRGGLAYLLEQGATINHAVRSKPWPGMGANVTVSLVTLFKGPWKVGFTLDQKPVERITSQLDDAEVVGEPELLLQNANRSFQGSIVLGTGFVLEPEEREDLLRQNPALQDVIFPYLNGDDLNTRPDQSPSRYVINFRDWPLQRYTQAEWEALSTKEQQAIQDKIKKGQVVKYAPPAYPKPVAADYPEALDWVKKWVKPERENQSDQKGKDWWWQFLRIRGKLYRTIAGMERVMAINRHSKTVSPEFVDSNIIASDATVVFAIYKYIYYTFMVCTLHDLWAWKNCSTMGEAGLRYTPSSAFQTFPFPQALSDAQVQELARLGQQYHAYRQQLMQAENEGLTTTYNRFHDPHEPGEQHRDLRRLHQQLDEAVLRAYGWEDLIGQAFPAADDAFGNTTLHGFYEQEYLPENDRVRFTLHPQARREVLKRLLKLNHQVHEQEQAELNKLPKNQRKPENVSLPEWMQRVEAGEAG